MLAYDGIITPRQYAALEEENVRLREHIAVLEKNTQRLLELNEELHRLAYFTFPIPRFARRLLGR